MFRVPDSAGLRLAPTATGSMAVPSGRREFGLRIRQLHGQLQDAPCQGDARCLGPRTRRLEGRRQAEGLHWLLVSLGLPPDDGAALKSPWPEGRGFPGHPRTQPGGALPCRPVCGLCLGLWPGRRSGESPGLPCCSPRGVVPGRCLRRSLEPRQQHSLLGPARTAGPSDSAPPPGCPRCCSANTPQQPDLAHAPGCGAALGTAGDSEREGTAR